MATRSRKKAAAPIAAEAPAATRPKRRRTVLDAVPPDVPPDAHGAAAAGGKAAAAAPPSDAGVNHVSKRAAIMPPPPAAAAEDARVAAAPPRGAAAASPARRAPSGMSAAVEPMSATAATDGVDSVRSISFECDEGLDDELGDRPSAAPAAAAAAAAPACDACGAECSGACARQLALQRLPLLQRVLGGVRTVVSVSALMEWSDAEDIPGAMRVSERRVGADPLYMRQQAHIDYLMRAILLDWMIEVSREFSLGRETLHLAINMVDRFLSQVHDLPRNQLQLLGVTCLFICSKLDVRPCARSLAMRLGCDLSPVALRARARRRCTRRGASTLRSPQTAPTRSNSSSRWRNVC